MTTGRLAGVFRSAASRATGPTEKAWLTAAAQALDEVVDLRNQVVHARPATFNGEQTLYRWATATDSKTHEAFRVDEGVFAHLRDRAAFHVGRLSDLRLPAAQA